MRNLTLSCFAAAIIICLSACTSDTKSEKSVSPIVGTWEYLNDLRGRAVLSENDFVFFVLSKPDSAYSDSLTAEEMLDRYKAMIVAAGSHIIKDTLVTCTNKFHSDPNMVGETWRWVYTIKGDELHW